MNNFIYFYTPFDQLQKHYNHISLDFHKDLYTQLPKNIAVIRSLAITAFTSLIAFGLETPIFRWSVAIAGVAYAGWTIYAHLLTKDPLIEAFHKICGGEQKFNQIPTHHLKDNQKIASFIKGLNWDELQQPVTRYITSDFRNIVVVKGLSRKEYDSDGQERRIFAFVEKISFNDFSKQISNISARAETIFKIFIQAYAYPFIGKHFNRQLKFSWANVDNTTETHQIYSYIPSVFANEFYAQLATKTV